MTRPGSCNKGFKSLPSAGAGNKRSNGLEVTKMNIRKPVDTKPKMPMTRATMAKGKAFRVGGMVKEGSLIKDGENVQFVVTDFAHEVPVAYKGILPDLFKEGKGVVAQGKLSDGQLFAAAEVLAKHDENYMPPEAQHALDEAAAARTAQSVKPSK